MARKRMIDPSIWSDEGFAELTDTQRLLYIGLFSNADDDGRLPGSAKAVQLMLPAVYGGAKLDAIERDLGVVLATMSKLRRYEVDRKQYLVFLNYAERQYIQRPSASHLPAPNFACVSDAAAGECGCVSDNGTITEDSRIGIGSVSPKLIEKKGIEKNDHGVSDNGSAVDGFDALFSLWWPHYPRKVNRQSALKAWRAIKPSAAMAERLTAAIDAQTVAKFGAMLGTERESYIPHASTWLNGRQWENDTPPLRPMRVSGVNAPYTEDIVE